VSDGHRAGKVIEGIRTMFKKSAQERVPLNLNQLIGDVLRRSQREAQLGRVSVEAELDEQSFDRGLSNLILRVSESRILRSPD
jgi:hypothetical protein